AISMRWSASTRSRASIHRSLVAHQQISMAREPTRAWRAGSATGLRMSSFPACEHAHYLPHRAVIRDARNADFPAIVALNAESERFLSPMSATRLNQLHAWAAYHSVVEVEGQVAAFLLAFREGAGYDSPNYRWFSARYASFVYIDRVVVAGVHRGKGFASALYDD